MGLIIAILIAFFFLEEPWNWILIGLGIVWEIGETVFFLQWSTRRKTQVGAETLIGRRAVVATECMPDGQVRIAGELWRAHCRGGAGVGDEVVVREVDGLTLVVEPE
jgi:membrane protein implicated in regulation of membrane protease activity